MSNQAASPAHAQEWDCVIIGAGIAGLSARRQLSSAGFRVLTLEKSRGLGGRMSTRRVEEGGLAGLVDLGAQFVSARSADFCVLLESLDAQDVQLPWDQGHLRHVPRGGMNTLAKALLSAPSASDDVSPILRGTRVIGVSWDLPTQHWRVTTEEGAVVVTRAVLLTAPLPQAIDLLTTSGIFAQTQSELSLAETHYTSCLAAYFPLGEHKGLPAPGLLKDVSPEISGLFDQREKGLRTQIRTLVVHAAPEFSRNFWECPTPEVLAELWRLAAPHLVDSEKAADSSVWNDPRAGLHRWRYCEPISPLALPYFRWGSSGPLYLAGDAFSAARVEGAFQSGMRAAHALASELEPEQGAQK